MKVKCKAPQPSPDEIIAEYFKNHEYSEIFVEGNSDCLTAEGKALFALGIFVYKAYKKAHK